jgi:hypothetical protein
VKSTPEREAHVRFLLERLLRVLSARLRDSSAHAASLWPEYLALATKLEARLVEVTDRLVREVVHAM